MPDRKLTPEDRFRIKLNILRTLTQGCDPMRGIAKAAKIDFRVDEDKATMTIRIHPYEEDTAEFFTVTVRSGADNA